MPDNSPSAKTISVTVPAHLPAGGPHTLQLARWHTRATQIAVSRTPEPGRTVTFTATRGDSFQVRNGELVSGSRRSATADELRRLRWRVHSGGVLIADTSFHEGPLTLPLPARLLGESVLAAAYTWEPFVHVFSHWWIPGRSADPAGGVRSAQHLGQIIRACGVRVPTNVDDLFEHLREPFSRGALRGTLQQAHFLAQAIHESVGMTTLEENTRGFNPGTRYGKKNGNTSPEDGAAFIGRGILQITGYSTYRAVFMDYLGNRYAAARGRMGEREWLRREAPRLATDPALAVRAGVYFWGWKPVQDRAALDDVLGASIRVNGWEGPQRLPLHYAERVRYTRIIKEHLGLHR